MRVWDIHPGYLNRQSLLGEHRELHSIVSIILNHKKGYSNHPETKRWVGYGWALKTRHKLLTAEMALRGYHDHSPVHTRSNNHHWPDTFIDHPAQQISLLKEKYRQREFGRIPLPQNTQQLWAQHKYSVMARDYATYQRLGTLVASIPSQDLFESIALELVMILRQHPNKGGLRNALQHMWGYVSDEFEEDGSQINHWPPQRLLQEIQRLAQVNQCDYLLHSTALTELAVWI